MAKCYGCNREESACYLTPQPPRFTGGKRGQALCTDCVNRHNAEARRRHKAALAAMPRCEIDGCKHRRTYYVSGVGLCGWHLRRVRRKMNRDALRSLGGLALFVTIRPTPDEVRQAAKEKRWNLRQRRKKG